VNWFKKQIVGVVVKRILKEVLMLTSLAGYKTYIVAIVVAVMTAVYQLGYIDQSTYQTALGWLGAAGLATLRAGIGSK